MSELYKKILITTDGSEYSMNSLKHALKIAKDNDAELIALSVIEDEFVMEFSHPEMIKEVKQALKEKIEDNLKKVKDLKEELGYDIKLTLKIEEGTASKVILKTIEDEDIDLVVIGSSGKSGFNKLVVGSVTNKVVNSAKCSVLVTK